MIKLQCLNKLTSSNCIKLVSNNCVLRVSNVNKSIIDIVRIKEMTLSEIVRFISDKIKEGYIVEII